MHWSPILSNNLFISSINKRRYGCSDHSASAADWSNHICDGEHLLKHQAKLVKSSIAKTPSPPITASNCGARATTSSAVALPKSTSLAALIKL